MAYKQHTVRLTLEEIGEPDLYIEMRDPRWMTQAELQAAEGDGGADVVRSLILDWNLPHPQTGEPLPLMAADNDSDKYIPLAIVRFLKDRMEGLMAAPLSATTKATS